VGYERSEKRGKKNGPRKAPVVDEERATAGNTQSSKERGAGGKREKRDQSNRWQENDMTTKGAGEKVRCMQGVEMQAQFYGGMLPEYVREKKAVKRQVKKDEVRTYRRAISSTHDTERKHRGNKTPLHT